MTNAITRRRRTELVVGAVLLAALAVLPLPIRDVYTQNLIILTVLYAGLSQAWNILGGYCGQISLGHALYFGIGAYVSTLLYVNAGIPPTAGMFAAGVVGALAALLVGWPCFRLSGHYYAIATVVVGEIGFLLFLNWEFVGAATGINVPFRGERLGGAAVPHLQAAVPLRRARLRGADLDRRLGDRGVALGLLLARGAGRRDGGALAGGARVPVQDGGGGDQRVLHRDGRARSTRSTSATSTRTACWPRRSRS